MSKKTDIIDIEAALRAELPEKFNVSVSTDKTVVQLECEVPSDSDWKKADCIVRKMCKKHKLEEIGAGTYFGEKTPVRDWDLRYKPAVRAAAEDGKKVIAEMQKFFNEHCWQDVDELYAIVEKMRNMVATDEM